MLPGGEKAVNGLSALNALALVVDTAWSGEMVPSILTGTRPSAVRWVFMPDLRLDVAKSMSCRTSQWACGTTGTSACAGAAP